MQCLVQLLIYFIVLLIVLWIVELIIAQFIPLPQKITMLIRILCALLMVIAALNCLGIFGMDGPGPFFRHNYVP